MKKYVIAILSVLESVAAFAQPTLTSATNKPIAGDVFYGHEVDTTNKSKGAAGVAVTWNFAALAEITKDTTTYLSCAATPYCDSFPGANIVSFDNTDYQYGVTSLTGFSIVGTYSDETATRLTRGRQLMFFPTTYNAVSADTFVIDLGGPPSVYVRGISSSKCDAYGTLILPSGTYTNVLRVHTVTVVRDSITEDGISFEDSTRTETYSWYAAGFHSPLLTMRYDTAAGVTYLSSMTYYTQKKAAAYATELVGEGLILVYPNPVSDEVHIKYNLATTDDASITVTDLLGKVVAIIGNDQMKVGSNDIVYPLQDLSPGLYMLSLNTQAGRTVQKILVTK